MTIQNGRLGWTPTQPGDHTVTIRATSSHGTTKTFEQTFTLQVVPAATDLPPHILTEPVTLFGQVNFVWRYNLNAHDPNGDAVAYSLSQAPAGMTIDPKSGFIQWTPASPGHYPVTVSAADGSATTPQSFIITIGDAVKLSGQQIFLPSITKGP